MSSKVILNDDQLTNIPIGEKFICMYSGGKDSALAYAMARDYSTPYALIHCLSRDNQESLNHMQSKDVIEAQAKSMNISLTYHYNHWTKWPQLIRLYNQYVQEGVKFVVFGDTYHTENVKLQVTLCESVGLIPCLPLWKMSNDVIVSEIEKRKIKSVITTINTRRISREWLGKVFNRSAYQHFCTVGIDPLGENSEYHTTLVDADFFSYPLLYNCIKIDEDHIKLVIR